jgi:hypothetical protein
MHHAAAHKKNNIKQHNRRGYDQDPLAHLRRAREIMTERETVEETSDGRSAETEVTVTETSGSDHQSGTDRVSCPLCCTFRFQTEEVMLP